MDRFISLLGLQDVKKHENETPEQYRNRHAQICKYEIRDAIEASEVKIIPVPDGSNNPDFGEVALYAVRYAIGRMTYAPFTVCSFLMPLIGYMEKNALMNIVREIDEHEQRHPYGLGSPTIDAPHWIALRGEIQAELSRREKGDGHEQT